jgi:hypothetical protein
MSEASRGRSAAITFWETLRDIRTPILTVEPVDLETAWQILQSFADQTFSFVDCTTFALMERVGIHEAFAFMPISSCTGSGRDANEPSFSAESSSSPFLSWDQPRSWAVVTSC